MLYPCPWIWFHPPFSQLCHSQSFLSLQLTLTREERSRGSARGDSVDERGETLPFVSLLSITPCAPFGHTSLWGIAQCPQGPESLPLTITYLDQVIISRYSFVTQKIDNRPKLRNDSLRCSRTTHRLNHWYTAVYSGLECLPRRLEEWELVRCQVRLIVNNTLLYSALLASLGKPCIPPLLFEQQFLFCPRFCTHEELASVWFVYRRYGRGDLFKMDS